MNIKLLSTAIIAIIMTGCATTSVQEKDKPKAERTKVAANMQEVRLTSQPEGATCEITRDAETLGSLAATPGYVTIKRSNFKNVDVTCSKEGYDTTTKVLKTIDMDNALDGNIGAAISLFKMAQGSLSSYEDSLFIKMDPSYFESTAARDTYLNDETSVMNSNFEKNSQQYLKCKKKKCAKALEEMQSSYDTQLAALKAKVTAIPVR